MTTLDELQRSVERLNRAVERLSSGMGKYGFANVYNDDVQLLLSERAELLATVERLRQALWPFAKLSEKFGHLTVVHVCKPHPLNPSPIIAPLLVRDLTEARAALTTGEATTPHPAPIKPSADTGELRERVARKMFDADSKENGLARDWMFEGGCHASYFAMADAAISLIQSERAGSPIGQNDQPGLAFSDAGEP